MDRTKCGQNIVEKGIRELSGWVSEEEHMGNHGESLNLVLNEVTVTKKRGIL